MNVRLSLELLDFSVYHLYFAAFSKLNYVFSIARHCHFVYVLVLHKQGIFPRGVSLTSCKLLLVKGANQ